MITCKLTGETGPSVKAHIIPKSFYEIPPQSDGPCKLMTNASGVRPKKMPIGIYDDTMVTRNGEEIFGNWDDYACKLLLNDFDQFDQICKDSRVIAWRKKEYDYSFLKLFALSVLWRTHASTQHSFSNVDLGPHEPEIRDMLLCGDPRGEEDYSVILSRWIDGDFGTVIMDPFSERYDGANYYRIYCGRYILYIKVDKKKTTAKFNDIQLAPDRDLYLIARELKESKEWPIMKKVALANS